MVKGGDEEEGGDSSIGQEKQKSIRKSYSNDYAFAAKLSDGRVVTWGDAGYGGDILSVHDKLNNVDTIYSTVLAFSAKLSDGRVVTWGFAYSFCVTLFFLD